MKRYTISSLLAICSLTLTGACAGRPSPTVQTTDTPYAPVIDPANFVTGVDNPLFPLQPGTTFIYEGQTEKGSERNEVVVTHDTREILGVTCVVVQDTVLVDGNVIEMTFDWYAQDVQGNVWYLGEDSKEYENGAVVGTAGSWEAGVDGAQPGIIMEANPVVGDAYRQEYYAGEAEDWAQVLSLDEAATVPYGAYSGLVMIEEWSGLDSPPVLEHKYYAMGTGFILERTVQGGAGEIALIEIRHE
jgi:hypothetical protein